MNKNLLYRLPKILANKKFLISYPYANSLKYCFSSQQNNQSVNHRFTYGQGGFFTFDLTKRTYSLSFQTIWQDHAQLTYSGLTGQNSFFITEKGKDVNMDDLDLELNQKEYIKIHSKIPEDYTIRGKINGSIHHLKNSVSSKTRSNPFQIEILGYKNTYQWLNLETEDVKITNKNGDVQIGSLTAKNALIDCESFRSKKVMYSGEVTLRASNKMEIRSIVAYQNALTKIQNSGDVYIESSSGKLEITNCKTLKIDRLLSCKDGINIECDKIHDHIIVQSGTGTIQCLKESKQVLKERIKLGKMHKGKLDFDAHEDPNSPYSKVLVIV